jgi:hypothetical protein
MKPQTDMVEGTEAFTRFENAMKKVLSVPKAEIQRRIEEHKKESALNPNKRGPKPKDNRKPG